ncbi:MAG TPA: flagellar hook-basal body complex protein FliE [Burkholderiaceae bacterium]|nr:flagellar hook-basal body complex protein FliE [Burkholderiaceae bacterium]
MNLPLLSALRAQQTGGAAQATGGAASSGKAAGGAEFAQSLKQALSSVSQAQNQAGRLQRDFQAGTEGVGLEETMVAMQKSQIGFQAALTVRNRLVSAYTDIMNMNV